jgi:uncharacterized protein (TIGR03435 family)
MTRLPFVVAILAFAALIPAGGLQAQDPLPAFDVASVKHNTSATARLAINRAPARLTVVGAPLSSLILMAYNVRASLARFTVEGMPMSGRPCTADCKTKDEVLSARFDVTATVPMGTTASNEQQMLMLRRLLAERFKLKTRTEMRDIPVYALTVVRSGQLGAQLRPSEHNCEVSRVESVCQNAVVGPGGTTLRSAGGLAALLRQIEGQLDRPAIDRTGLKGNFEWRLTYELRPPERDLPAASRVPGIDAALQEQLGLRLVPLVAPHDVLTIESAEMPTPD